MHQGQGPKSQSLGAWVMIKDIVTICSVRERNKPLQFRIYYIIITSLLQHYHLHYFRWASSSLDSPTEADSGSLGSGPRYQILSHVYARWASQKTYGRARVVYDSRMAVGFLTHATCKKVWHKSHTSGHCLRVLSFCTKIGSLDPTLGLHWKE